MIGIVDFVRYCLGKYWYNTVVLVVYQIRHFRKCVVSF
jgi:hypothetical protein